MTPKQQIICGWPVMAYTFTGQWKREEQGYYSARRNRQVVYVPEYISSDGHKIYDMTQAQKQAPATAPGATDSEE